MTDRAHIDRRDFLRATSAVLALAVTAPAAFANEEVPSAEALAAAESQQYRDAYAKLVGLRTPLMARVAVDIPDSNENGNIVPYKLAVESAMAGDDMIKSLTLLSTGNPQPVVATFHFTEFSGRAAVAGRMRLAKSQTVVALAETSLGELLIGKTFVGVTVGGCGSD